MAKPTAPLFARAASGTLAHNLTYSNYRGRPYLKRRAAPRDPRTDAQLASRAIMRWLQSTWSTITAPDQATWDAHPDRPTLSRYHCYLATNLANWSHHHGPSHAYPAAETYPDALLLGFGATAEVRQVRLHIQMDLYDTYVHCTLHRSLAPATPQRPDNLIAIVTCAALDTYYTDTTARPGVTYWYRPQTLSPSGYLVGEIDDQSATPLP